MSTKVKDPDADLDYFFNWTPFLGEDTINTFTVTSSHADLVIGDSPPPWKVGNIVYFWAQGGKDGEEYTVECHIETNNSHPRKDDRTMRIVCKQK